MNLKSPIDVKVEDDRTLKRTKVVYFVKDMDKNLLSFAKVPNKDKIITVGGTSEIYNSLDDLIGIACKENQLHRINSYVDRKESCARNVETIKN